jgi:FtsP/CotA-like multicopper oxidase with cupredoxin domain
MAQSVDLNGEAFSMDTMKPMCTVHEGRRYRLKFRNASDDIHPLHLHRHSFELTRIGGKPTAERTSGTRI